MTEHDRVLDAFRNCITESKCKNCPWTECDEVYNRKIEIPADLALAVMRMLTNAIHVEWLVNLKNEYAREGHEQAEGDLMNLLLMWQKEQEAKDGKAD